MLKTFIRKKDPKSITMVKRAVRDFENTLTEDQCTETIGDYLGRMRRILDNQGRRINAWVYFLCIQN